MIIMALLPGNNQAAMVKAGYQVILQNCQII